MSGFFNNSQAFVAGRFASSVWSILFVHRNHRLPRAFLSHAAHFPQSLYLLAPGNIQRHHVRPNCGCLLVCSRGHLQRPPELSWRVVKSSNLGYPRVLMRKSHSNSPFLSLSALSPGCRNPSPWSAEARMVGRVYPSSGSRWIRHGVRDPDHCLPTPSFARYQKRRRFLLRDLLEHVTEYT